MMKKLSTPARFFMAAMFLIVINQNIPHINWLDEAEEAYWTLFNFFTIEISSEETKKSNDKIIPGDANCDGVVDIVDVRAMLDHISGRKALTDEGYEAACVSGNGEISIIEVRAVLDHITGRNKLK